MTGNLNVTYVPVVVSVGNPDYLRHGHYAINKGIFIKIILIISALNVFCRTKRISLCGNDARRIRITLSVNR